MFCLLAILKTLGEEMIYLHFKQIMQTCFLKNKFLCVQY